MFRYTYNTLVYGREPLAAGIARIAKFGYDGVELVGEPAQHDVGEVRRELDKHGVRASSVISIFTPERDLVSADSAVRRRALDYLRGNVDYAAALGADVVTFTPTACMKIVPEADRDREWAWALDAARAIAAYADDHGVRIAVEPWNRYETYLINRMDQAIAFVDEAGHAALGCMADTFHMALEERDIAAAIRRCGHRLVHVHLADSNRAAPGYGHTDFRPIVQAIAEVGYTGWIAYELLPAAGDVWGVLSGAGAPEFLDTYTEAAIAHTKKLEAELGLV
ncbi:sugar phosphate isomerase/epimerase [Amycolatopsis acidiphila]|uniref:Sugar phosphate isomerase/epimerase n=1 Tax=Amycolatopsis acidiphila TaxID=715473 RepID=A0A558AJ75_9PSEU|nr:sugar phosphate isomerase/epimerase family protein [Amycolatopsis acidiphila]TVT24313.1 sugar phosphate isomerase/epimerase [Amycolatopsis acidiphila]UIJ62554.1 sugar phosphate isomerase/epimerase [Amycolatopsis acidiphila]GHG85389.1 epimerase [Amycolatopsis acidiphila]